MRPCTSSPKRRCATRSSSISTTKPRLKRSLSGRSYFEDQTPEELVSVIEGRARRGSVTAGRRAGADPAGERAGRGDTRDAARWGGLLDPVFWRAHRHQPPLAPSP